MRGNGGGNVSPMLIERLRREIAMIDIARNSVPHTDPGGDDLRAEGLPDERVLGFGRRPVPLSLPAAQARQADRQAQLGRRGRHPRLAAVPGRRLSESSPEFSRYDVDGKEWIIEGARRRSRHRRGQRPGPEYAGDDEQLDKAIAVVKEELKTKEKDIPPPPPYPKNEFRLAATRSEAQRQRALLHVAANRFVCEFVIAIF